jgi:hypothetical protein
VKTFELYRANPPPDYVAKGQAVAPDRPQLSGIVFGDGTTVIRWHTLAGSVAVFPSFADFEQIHAHPEYGTRLVWLTGPWWVPEPGKRPRIPPTSGLGPPPFPALPAPRPATPLRHVPGTFEWWLEAVAAGCLIGVGLRLVRDQLRAL